MTQILVPQNPSWPAFITSHLRTILNLKYGPPHRMGWSPQLRQRFGYCTPDELYEAAVAAFVGNETAWLDVGCGRDVFPSNPAAAEMLARRCRLLVGLDPSSNVEDNPFVHERVRCSVEEYRTDRLYDLVTMRMVAEHIEAPEATVAALGRLLKPEGRLVVYTVRKWSPAALAATVTPMSVHHWAKRLLWDTEERDTFPTFYRMNNRRKLRHLFAANSFVEEAFLWLDDVRTFGKWKTLSTMELRLWRWLHAMGLAYPETCILGIYRKAVEPATQA